MIDRRMQVQIFDFSGRKDSAAKRLAAAGGELERLTPLASRPLFTGYQGSRPFAPSASCKRAAAEEGPAPLRGWGGGSVRRKAWQRVFARQRRFAAPPFHDP